MGVSVLCYGMCTGQALCEGFNNMGYKLNKPTLRAQMEYDCSRIARGANVCMCVCVYVCLLH